ncbi:MAG: SCP2 sterol-binding domain-containing protein [Thermoplasmataceae archaeon]
MSTYSIIAELVEKAKGQPDISAELKGFNKTFQFNPEGSEKFYLEIKDGNLTLKNGEIQGASATISGQESVLSDVLSGKLDPVMSFMSGKLKVSGDIFSAQKLTTIAKKFRK